MEMFTKVSEMNMMKTTIEKISELMKDIEPALCSKLSAQIMKYGLECAKKAKQEVFDDLERARTIQLSYSIINNITWKEIREKHLHPISDNSTKKTVI